MFPPPRSRPGRRAFHEGEEQWGHSRGIAAALEALRQRGEPQEQGCCVVIRSGGTYDVRLGVIASAGISCAAGGLEGPAPA
jgi:hypothetical protein